MWPFDSKAIRPRHRIYLVSTAGLPNFGDEFITRAWLQYLAKHRPDDDVWLDCSNPGHASILFRGIHPNLHIVNTLWQLVWNTRHLIDNQARAALAIEGWIRHGGTPREDLGIDLLRDVDSIHFLGGGYVNQLWKANILLFVAASAVKAINPSVSLHATGLGLSPLEGESLSLLHQAISSFDTFTVRDEQSASLTGTTFTCDDAFLAFGKERNAWQDNKTDRSAFVCLQHDVIGENQSAIPKIVDSLLQSDVSYNEILTVVEALPPDDAWALDSLHEQWKGKVELLPFSLLWNVGFPVSTDAVWISSRFHTHLIAAATGARGVAMEFGNDYYHIKHQSLLDLGTGWSVLDCSDPNNSAPSSHATKEDSFPQKAHSLFKQKSQEVTKIYDSSTQQ